MSELKPASQDLPVAVAGEVHKRALSSRLTSRLMGRILSAFQIEKSEEGYRLQLSRLSRWFVNGYGLAVLVVAMYFFMFFGSVIRFPLFSPAATVDEQLAYYTVARNFAQFGFMKTFFLHDMSTSSDPAHHPFIYNHMPPGPEILVAVIMKLFRERFGLVRFVLAAIFMVGLAYYIRFAGLVLKNVGLGGEAYTLLLISPWPLLHAMDHPAYSAFPFFAFFPLVALDSYYKTGRQRYYYGALAVVFISSTYVTVHNFLMIALSWILIYALGLARFSGRHLGTFLAVALFGVVLQFLRMAAFLGPTVFIKDLLFTLSNRMFGVPTPEELMAFYRGHDMVLHGTHTFRPFGLLQALNGALRVPGRLLIVVLGVMVVGWSLLRISRIDLRRSVITVPSGVETAAVWSAVGNFFRIGVWLVGIASIPILLFPAYSVDYDLQGLTQFFAAIGAVAILAYVFRELMEEGSYLSRNWAPGVFWRLGAWVIVILVLVLAVESVARIQLTNWKQTVKEFVSGTTYVSVLDIEKYFRGKVVMTNVYPLTVGFFTREATFGGCEFPAFPSEGGVRPGACHTAWIKGYGRTAEVRPTHYILFRGLFTGFTSCKDECLDRLYERVNTHQDKVFESKLFTVFALRT